MFAGSAEGPVYILNNSNTQDSLANGTAPIISLENLPNYLLAAGNTLGIIQIWDLINKNIKTTIYHSGEITCILTINNSHFASASSLGSIIIWNLVTFNPDLNISNAHSNTIKTLKASENILYSVSEDMFLKKWGSVQNSTNLGAIPTAIEFIDDLYLACSCLDKTVKIFDLQFTLVKKIHTQTNVYSLKYLGNDNLVFGFENGLAELWDLGIFSMVKKIQTGHIQIVSIEFIMQDLLALLCFNGHIFFWDLSQNNYLNVYSSFTPKTIKAFRLIQGIFF